MYNHLQKTLKNASVLIRQNNTALKLSSSLKATLTTVSIAMSSTLAAVVATAALSSSAYAAPKLLDKVVAVVDRSIISQSELDGRILRITARSQAGNVNLPPIEVLREQVLDQLILETLQINLAQRYGAIATDQEVFAAIQRIMQQQNMTQEQLIAELQRDGETINEFQESMRKQITMQNIAQGVVSNRIKISEQDIDNFLNSADAQFWISPDFHLGHILISVPSSASNDDIQAAEAKARKVYEQAKAGANFAGLAIANSNGPAALEGGDLGWKKSGDLPTLFAEAAPKLSPGDVTEPMRSQAGFHVLKLYDKRGDNTQMITQTKSRHILIETSEIVSKDQAIAKLIDLRTQILNGEDFPALAKEHSDDIATKLSGGDLGWSTPGIFVPEFEKIMATLKDNEISQPFVTQFGWHIMQVLERREEDFTDKVIRNKARNLLISRRFEDEVQVWLQEMKDDAFVEVKI